MARHYANLSSPAPGRAPHADRVDLQRDSLEVATYGGGLRLFCSVTANQPGGPRPSVGFLPIPFAPRTARSAGALSRAPTPASAWGARCSQAPWPLRTCMRTSADSAHCGYGGAGRPEGPQFNSPGRSPGWKSPYLRQALKGRDEFWQGRALCRPFRACTGRAGDPGLRPGLTNDGLSGRPTPMPYPLSQRAASFSYTFSAAPNRVNRGAKISSVLKRAAAFARRKP